MSNSNYTEWTPEKKKEWGDERMLEMKSKNQMLERRHAEVENDRLAAESQNSAITNALKAQKKEKNINVPKTEYSREWDKGKPDKDHWRSPDRHSSFRNYRSGHHDQERRRSSDRRDSWGRRPKNDRDDYYDRPSSGNYDRRDSWSGKSKGSYRHKDTVHSHSSPKRKRTSYKSGDSRKPHYSYSDDKYKKSDYNRSNLRRKYSTRTPSKSSSRSGSDSNQCSKLKYSALWRNEKIDEDQTKQNRVEKWVKSVNKTGLWSGEAKKSKSYSKFDRFAENSSNESSEDEGKKDYPKESMLSYSKRDSPNNKCQNTGTFSSSVVPHSGGSEEHKRYMKNKRGPQVSSTGSFNNEHVRKQMRIEDDKGKYLKSRVNEKNMSKNSWNNNAVREKKDAGHRKFNFHGKNPKLDDDFTWGARKQSNADDGWASIDQSHIEWKLSDEERDDERDAKRKSSKQKAVNKNDAWNNNNNNEFSSLENSAAVPVKSWRRKETKEETATGGIDDIWGNVDQSDVKWNLSEDEILSKADSGLEDNSNEDEAYKRNVDEITNIMKEKCNLGVISDDERNGSQEKCENSPNVTKDKSPRKDAKDNE